MKTAAIIAEFNPFHKGHKYLLDTVKKEYGIDYCVAIMSGDYVQRGDVAIFNKHIRAQMAVKAGYSAVFELPLLYASSSAPDFAYGGVCLADALGVDYLVFGSESGDLAALDRLAQVMTEPNSELDSLIKAGVKEGLSYAKAVSEALKSCGLCNQDFSAPNDILAVEYLKSLKKLHSKVLPIAIKRKGPDHNSSEVSESIASASYIRSQIKNGQEIDSYLPEAVECKPLFIDDFFEMLSYRLHFISDEDLNITLGVSKDLANKIKKSSNAASFSDLVASCKSRNFPESTIRRALLHILLGVQKTDSFFPEGHIIQPTALRLLAISQNDSAVIKLFKKKGHIAIYTKPKEISDQKEPLLLLDMKVSDLYEKVYSYKYNSAFLADCQKSPTVL